MREHRFRSRSVQSAKHYRPQQDPRVRIAIRISSLRNQQSLRLSDRSYARDQKSPSGTDTYAGIPSSMVLATHVTSLTRA